MPVLSHGRGSSRPSWRRCLEGGAAKSEGEPRTSRRSPASLDEALTQVQGYVDHYNHGRPHSAIDYLTPADKLNGMGPMILEQRDQRLEEAHARRQQHRTAAKAVA